MKIIIPMAGMGKRLRPHTLTVPKPLLPIAGKPLVQWIAEDIAKVCVEKIDEIAFIIGDFGAEVEQKLIDVANSLGAKGKIYYQKEALGTAHAVLCAEKSLSGKVIVAFADTLFSANFQLEEENEGIIWVQKIEDPSQFGVVKVNEKNEITDFVEKPKEFISDLAIIGIYYFKDGENLKQELQYLIDNKIIKSGEYQLTDALENMKAKGLKFKPGNVDEWLDCGNKDAVVHTNNRILELKKNHIQKSKNITIKNSEIIEPCYFGENVSIIDSKIGPCVSIGANSSIENAVVSSSIIQTHSKIRNTTLTNSMIGNFVDYEGNSTQLSIGDYSVFKN